MCIEHCNAAVFFGYVDICRLFCEYFVCTYTQGLLWVWSAVNKLKPHKCIYSTSDSTTQNEHCTCMKETEKARSD